jgi:hypothetical protein
VKHAVEVGSGAMIYVPSFIRFVSGIQKLLWSTHRHTGGTVISYVYFNFILLSLF